MEKKMEAQLWAEKRERQAASREKVKMGQETQTQQFFIAPDLAKTAKVKHRCLSW